MKVKNIKPYTAKYEKLANQEAMDWVQIHPCCECGHPVIKGYCCSYCRSTDPLSKNYY